MNKKKNSASNKNKSITLGLIAAREGSVGVKNKNLIKIKNNEITKIAVNLAINCSNIDDVVISSDCKKILGLVKENKKLLKLKRNKNLARSNTPMLPVIRNAVDYFEKVKIVNTKRNNITGLILPGWDEKNNVPQNVKILLPIKVRNVSSSLPEFS